MIRQRYLWESDIAILSWRVWWHCAYSLFKYLHVNIFYFPTLKFYQILSSSRLKIPEIILAKSLGSLMYFVKSDLHGLRFRLLDRQGLLTRQIYVPYSGNQESVELSSSSIFLQLNVSQKGLNVSNYKIPNDISWVKGRTKTIIISQYSGSRLRESQIFKIF